MDLGYIVLLFAIGFIASLISGMVGIGGAVIKYPLLLLVPQLFGYVAFTAHEVSGLNAIQVFFATLAAVFALRNEDVLNMKLILYMGTAVLVGSFIGGYGAQFLSNETVNIVFIALAFTALVMMFIPKPDIEGVPYDQVTFNRWLAAGSAFFVGLFSGVVGAGGGFILVPIMLLILRIPTRMTIATSLAVAFLNSIGATVGKILANEIIWGPAIVLVIASILGAPVGAKLTKVFQPKTLQYILTALIALTVFKMTYDIIFPVTEIPADVPVPESVPES